MANKGLKKGIFITFEGAEGCGKTTQAELLVKYLRSRSYECVTTREPGGTKLGERVREILLHSKKIKISPLTELFLFEACRSQIVEELIIPSLSKKNIVVCDRFSDATLSYQGYGGKVPVDIIRSLNAVAVQGVRPDLTILLDLDAVEGLRRAKRKGIDRMENKDIRYHKRVRAGYLALAKQDPRRIRLIKVTGSIDQTQALVRKEAEFVIQRYKRPG